MAISDGGRLREGRGSRAFLPFSAGGSAEKLTSRSCSPAIARTAAPTARLNGSEGLSGFTLTSPLWGGRRAQQSEHVGWGAFVRAHPRTRNASHFDLPTRGR